MNEVIDKIINGLKSIQALDIADDEKKAHITGILLLADILLNKETEC